jgi:hypothetical protein
VSGVQARQHSVSTRLRDSFVRAKRKDSVNHNDGAGRQYRNEGHRCWAQTPLFPLLSHIEYTMYFGTTIQFYTDTVIQSQYTSSQAHTLQVRWRRVAPMCREHFWGGVPKSIASSLRGNLWCDAKSRSASPTEQSIFVKNVFADLID